MLPFTVNTDLHVVVSLWFLYSLFMSNSSWNISLIGLISADIDHSVSLYYCLLFRLLSNLPVGVCRCLHLYVFSLFLSPLAFPAGCHTTLSTPSSPRLPSWSPEQVNTPSEGNQTTWPPPYPTHKAPPPAESHPYQSIINQHSDTLITRHLIGREALIDREVRVVGVLISKF